MKIRATSTFAVKLTISAGLLIAVLWQLGGIGDVMHSLLRLDPWYAVVVLLINTADRVLMSFKWSQLLRSRHERLPLFRAMMIYCASMVWGLLLPTTVGADVIRAASAARTGLKSDVVVSSIIIERLIGFVSAILLGIIGLFLLYATKKLDARFDLVIVSAGAMLLISMAVFALSFSERFFDACKAQLSRSARDSRLVQRLAQFHATYRTYQRDKKTLGVFFALTFTEQLLPILHAWFIAQALGVDVDLLYMAGVLPLAILISRLPISIDGLGVFETVFILLLSLASVSSYDAFAIALAGRILQTASWLPWWLAHMLQMREFRVPHTAEAAK